MTTVLTLLPAACGGFLLAVLWMDLIFDAQVLPHRQSADQLPEPVLASIAGYYHRATTSSRPMSTLIAVVMVILLGALAVQAMTGPAPGWLIAVSVASAGGPVLIALIRTVPNAVRLGKRADSLAEQTRLARAIFHDHVVCFALMLLFVGLWLAEASLRP